MCNLEWKVMHCVSIHTGITFYSAQLLMIQGNIVMLHCVNIVRHKFVQHSVYQYSIYCMLVYKHRLQERKRQKVQKVKKKNLKKNLMIDSILVKKPQPSEMFFQRKVCLPKQTPLPNTQSVSAACEVKRKVGEAAKKARLHAGAYPRAVHGTRLRDSENEKGVVGAACFWARGPGRGTDRRKKRRFRRLRFAVIATSPGKMTSITRQ